MKESSDELNPTVTTPAAAIPAPKKARTALDYVALALATWGVGYLPVAPGTFGSLVGVALFVILKIFAVQLLVTLTITFLGIWAATQTERILRLKDPGKVVVDEVAGQMIALLPLSLFTVSSPKLSIIVSFILFRLFDILKPYPARRLEALRGGWGIMADDLAAGTYAALGTIIAIGIL